MSARSVPQTAHKSRAAQNAVTVVISERQPVHTAFTGVSAPQIHWVQGNLAKSCYYGVWKPKLLATHLGPFCGIPQASCFDYMQQLKVEPTGQVIVKQVGLGWIDLDHWLHSTTIPTGLEQIPGSSLPSVCASFPRVASARHAVRPNGQTSWTNSIQPQVTCPEPSSNTRSLPTTEQANYLTVCIRTLVRLGNEREQGYRRGSRFHRCAPQVHD